MGELEQKTQVKLQSNDAWQKEMHLQEMYVQQRKNQLPMMMIRKADDYNSITIHSTEKLFTNFLTVAINTLIIQNNSSRSLMSSCRVHNFC